jgi:hypothetical protein
VPSHQHLTFLLIAAVLVQTPFSQAADLEEIVRRGTVAIHSDWAADPDYAYIERDEVRKSEGVSSKTSQVVMIEGSDYYLPLAINDEPFSADRQKAELAKLKSEYERRKNEGPAERRQRIDKYKNEEDENGALLLDFPDAFLFELKGEGSMDGHAAYILGAAPRKRSGPLSNAAKVLGGMHGTLWIDKESFHVIRAKCDVISPVPIYGILARVLPGTHIEFGMTPVNDSTWFIDELSMNLTVAKLYFFKSTRNTRTTYTGYRPNAEALKELLAKADAGAAVKSEARCRPKARSTNGSREFDVSAGLTFVCE